MFEWMLLFWILIFIAALTVLIKGSDWFIASAERIGLYFGVKPFIIGVTILAIGTSLPELVSSIAAVVEGAPEIVAGTVIGSNIANMTIILGVVAIMARKIRVNYKILNVDLPFIVGTAFFLAITCIDWTFQGNPVFTWKEGLLGIALMIVYLVYNTKVERVEKIPLEKVERKASARKFLGKELPILMVTGVMIWLGAKYLVDSVIVMSDMLNIGRDLIATAVIAFGSSVPELVVSLQAIRRMQGEMGIGNVIGSNIFNSLGVMGIPSLFGTLVISHQILTYSLPVMVFVTIMYFFIIQDNEITKWEGYLLVAFYLLFIGKLFNIF